MKQVFYWGFLENNYMEVIIHRIQNDKRRPQNNAGVVFREKNPCNSNKNYGMVYAL